MDSPSTTPQIVTGMSESVFVGLCRILGTSQQVAMRRDVKDIGEIVRNKVITSDQRMVMMLSGSTREGFRMEESDLDFMCWFNDNPVIWDLSQTQLYNVHRQALILSVSSESPPGFTLLKLLTPRARDSVISALVPMNGRLYISSSKYREITCSAVVPNSTVHGPCGSGTIAEQEYDTAQVFVCEFWPPSASSWIDRCHTWPQPQVVRDIVRSGCHFVAIGHKLGKHESNEWRISFSLAEQKLVYSMNHCQFLTYGLLKLFLKEVINGLGENEKLLCSYHMKTAVFWMIQRNTIPIWCPQNLLKCFWYCFKLILKWVYEGVCPNFFIPENNMFLSNIHGEAQNRLFVRLFGFYEKGLIASLLHSPSLRPYIVNILYNPRLSICTDERTLVSETELDEEMFFEIHKTHIGHSPDLHISMKYLNTVEQLTTSPLTQYQVVMLQVLTAYFLCSAAFTLQNMYSSNTTKNKLVYITDRMSCHMLKLTSKFGCISDRLYIAMYYYKTLRYTEALSVIQMTKVNLAQPYMTYNGAVDTERYTEAVGGQSWSTKLRHAVAWDIALNNEIIYINELMTEQSVSLQNYHLMYIPPLVVLHMLEFLCYRHIDTMRAQTALDDLQVLVHHDQGVYVPLLSRDISWQILGICQQISGNLQAALYSYQQSLRQFPIHKIQSATLMRIHELR